jgi:hypothetical protein
MQIARPIFQFLEFVSSKNRRAGMLPFLRGRQNEVGSDLFDSKADDIGCTLLLACSLLGSKCLADTRELPKDLIFESGAFPSA